MASTFDQINAFPDSEIPQPRLRTICHLWALAAVLASAGVAALAADIPVASLVQEGKAPELLQKLCSLSEVFSHAWGLVLIAITIAVIDPWHRYAIPRILAASLGSGVVANIFKLFVARTRPHHFDLPGQALDTFSSWLPMFTRDSGHQSFPSAHAATAAGFAIVLASYYPRGRWLFPVFAALAGAQRVLEQSHFTSDVFWGAAVGCIFAPLCVYGGRLSGAFDRLEERLVARSPASSTLQGPHRRGVKVTQDRPKSPGSEAA